MATWLIDWLIDFDKQPNLVGKNYYCLEKIGHLGLKEFHFISVCLLGSWPTCLYVCLYIFPTRLLTHLSLCLSLYFPNSTLDPPVFMSLSIFSQLDSWPTCLYVSLYIFPTRLLTHLSLCLSIYFPSSALDPPVFISLSIYFPSSALDPPVFISLYIFSQLFIDLIPCRSMKF